MAYMNQERKAKIVKAMKPVMAKYGIKGTFKCSRHSITFNIREGAVDFLAHISPEQAVYLRADVFTSYHFGINPYRYDRDFTGVAKELLDEVIAAMQAADYYNNSDIMTDYFDCQYYYNVNVGTWEKPYALTT